MKKIFVMCACVAAMVLASCSTPSRAVNQLDDLTQEIRANSADYTISDWKRAVGKYEKVNLKIEKYALKGKYTPEEMTEIGRKQGECTAEMAKGAGTSLYNKAITIGNNVKGVVEGFKKALGL